MADRVILHLIRHEKTAANYARKYIGWTDEPIVDSTIRAQVPLTPQVVYGSDLRRCQQTAACYFPQANYEAHPRLRETSFGQFELKTYEELKQNKLYRAWIDCPGNNPPPDGETFASFEARVQEALADIVNQEGSYTFVVHGGVIRLLLAQFTQRTFQEVTAQHRMLYTLEWATLEAYKEGLQCRSLSAVPITVKDIM